MENQIFASNSSGALKLMDSGAVLERNCDAYEDVSENQFCYQSGAMSRNNQALSSEDRGKIAMGAEYGGGVIFYVDATGKHGLIVAKADLTTRFSGESKEGLTWYDAEVACNLLESNGYTDWFLPNKEQLRLLYLNKAVSDFTGNHYYWSSSEYNADLAWVQNFSNGTQYLISKMFGLDFVRAVRSF